VALLQAVRRGARSGDPIDATIVRAVLLPATMKLLGEWNWYLPSWLQWLPRLEPATEPASEPAPELPAAPSV
jgi:uncharacterized membrane protein YdfJ with MMPL/SSD domain